MVGGGEDEKALRHLATKLNCAQQVIFEGDLREARAHYFNCDIIAHPSRWEGCSYALLEAMAAGRAIIASDAGGNPEVLGDTGVVIKETNPAVWASEIIALARDDNKRQTLSFATLERATNQFPLRKMVDRTLTVYERVTTR